MSLPVLSLGSRGSSVADLQRKLAAKGFNPGPADGIFGNGTLNAVRAFQRSKGLAADGIVGNNTWAALDSFTPAPAPSSGGTTLSQGSSGASVTVLQGLLASHGFSPGPADGIFGPATRAAVIRFQQSRGLTPDGIVGPNTWAALRSANTTTPPSGGGQPVLRYGASGSAVVTLQQRLVAHGFSPGGVDGQFGGGTLGAVRQFQAAAGLTADGVVGPATWAALMGSGTVQQPGSGGSSNPDIRQRILDVARSQLGVQESGNNGGGARIYQSYFGRGQEAWCADFVSWVYSHAGESLNYAYVPYLENHLKQTGQWKGRSNPQPGDIVIFDWNGDGVADHVGLVEYVDGSGVHTIEGNTGNGSGSGPDGVYRRTRPMADIVGFGNP